MKKLFLILAFTFLTSGFVNFAQIGQLPEENVIPPGGDDACVQNLIAQMFACLTSLNVTGNLIEANDQLHLFVFYESTDPAIRGKIQSCVSDYNNSRNECADAPVMVIKKN
ncbi:MAG: hypothetical protein HY738_06690 [Bacteroidia bacterium]|nr:hypothetical protein [Bacteroidia bacterium]